MIEAAVAARGHCHVIHQQFRLLKQQQERQQELRHAVHIDDGRKGRIAVIMMHSHVYSRERESVVLPHALQVYVYSYIERAKKHPVSRVSYYDWRRIYTGSFLSSSGLFYI